MRRRKFLASMAAGVGAVGLSGCFGTSDAGEKPLAENPVARDLDERPHIGPGYEESRLTLVVFDDPNCGNCASFHSGAFQTIESDWVDDGTASVYSRSPALGGWSEMAAHGLEETHDRNPDAFWTLLNRYFANQDDMSEDNVVERTRSFLSDADVDEAAVATAIENEAHSEILAADADAADAANDGPFFATPKTWVFEDGEFVAVVGNEGFDAFESAVEGNA